MNQTDLQGFFWILDRSKLLSPDGVEHVWQKARHRIECCGRRGRLHRLAAQARQGDQVPGRKTAARPRRVSSSTITS